MILPYTTSHVDPALLDRLTAGDGRRALIDELQRAVRDEIGRGRHQHHLIVAPRGSGKTHTLSILAHRLRTSDVAGELAIVTLSEEETCSQDDFLLRVLQELTAGWEEWGGSPRLLADLTLRAAALRGSDAEKLVVGAAAALEHAAKELGRLIVVVAENLQSILHTPMFGKASGAEQWPLRAALLKHPGLVVVGSTMTRFGAINDTNAAFYGFFREHDLPELTPDEMVALFEARLDGEAGGDQERQTRLEALRSRDRREITARFRGLVTLTGGLPRMGHLLFEVLLASGLDGIERDLKQFLDEQTPYFQPWLDPNVLPRAELRALDALALADAPLTAAEIAKGTGESQAVVGKALQRLVQQRGLVRYAPGGGRAKRYECAEPLFAVWRRFRVRRDARGHLVVLAEFVSALYEPITLAVEASVLRTMDPAHPRLRLLDAAWDAQAPSLAAEGTHDAVEVDQLLREAEAQYAANEFAAAMALFAEAADRLERCADRRLTRVLSWLASAAEHAGDATTALRASDRGLTCKPDPETHAELHDIRAGILGGQGHQDKALQGLREIDLPSVSTARHALVREREAWLLLTLGQVGAADVALVEAERYAVESGEEGVQVHVLSSRANVAARRGALEEARVFATRAVDLAGSAYARVPCLVQRAELNRLVGHADATLADLDLAEELMGAMQAPHLRARLHFERGRTLLHVGCHKEAASVLLEGLAEFKQLGDLGAQANTLVEVAQCHIATQRDREAEEALDRADRLYGRAHVRSGHGIVARIRSIIHFRHGPSRPRGFALLVDAARHHRGAGEIHNQLFTVRDFLEAASESVTGGHPDEVPWDDLIEILAPVAERGGPSLAQLAADIAVHHPSPVALLDRIAAALPPPTAERIRPARIAAEVRAGAREAELPDEPEEMRRAVREVFARSAR